MAEPGQYEKLKSALGPASDCPPFDQLVRALEANQGETRRKAAEEHTAGCAHCRDEVAMLHEFTGASPRPDEAPNVDRIVRRLGKQRVFRPSRQGVSFFFGMRAWASAACLLLVAAAAFYLPRGPGEPSLGVAGREAMRSQALELLDPVGDVRQKPAAFRWRAVTGAVRYHVRLMEVDGHEVWQGEATDAYLPIPAPVLTLMAPGRSLLWEVSAWDQAGKALGTSGTRSFRMNLK